MNMNINIDYFDVRGITVANIYSISGMASFCIAIEAGSLYETPEQAGIAHFAEHLLFKGTKNRNYKELSREFGKLGITINAFTYNREIVLYATFPVINTQKAISIIMDMFFNSKYPIKEIEKEKNVIMEEINSSNDNPKTAFIDIVSEKFFTWSLGHNALGTYETVKNIKRHDIISYLNSRISLSNFVLIFSGKIKSNELKQYIEDSLASIYSQSQQSHHPYLLKKNTKKIKIDTPWSDFILSNKTNTEYIIEKENIEQSSLVFTMEWLPIAKKSYIEIHAANILVNALGEDFYSCLIKRIREELGLCYEINAFPCVLNYPDHVILFIYSYTSPKNVNKIIKEVDKIIKNIAKRGLNKSLFECAKIGYSVSILKNIETSLGKIFFTYYPILLYKKYNPNKMLNSIEDVTINDCNELAKILFNNPYHIAIMNPKKNKI